MEVKLKIVIKCYEWSKESSVRENELDFEWVKKMYGFKKFRSVDLKKEKEATYKN